MVTNKEFLEMIYENAKAHNYSEDNYYELLNVSSAMASLDLSTEFSKDNIDDILPQVLGEEEITYHIIHLYHYFSKDNPVFQRQMVKYLERYFKENSKERAA